MAYPIHTLKSAKTGKFFAVVRTVNRVNAPVLFRSEESATAADAYAAAVAWRNAQTEQNKARKTAKDSDRMHCQCCGKLWMANTGTIAHHGYQRPGQGWQTASCMGAKALPFEVSRDTLGELIRHLTNWKVTAVESRRMVEAETTSVVIAISDRSRPRDWKGKYPTKYLDVTRENFDALSAEHGFYRLGHYDFDHVKARDLRRRDSEIKGVTEEIAAQQARYDGWKQTHKREGKEWVAL